MNTKEEVSPNEESNAERERPSLLAELTAGIEWAALKTSPAYYGLGVPHGNGEPVVLVPGLLASDLSLIEMRLWLGRLGYRVYKSGVGINADCPDVLVDRVLETIDRAYEETGMPVRLIGHSLGGLLARSAAGLASDKVAQVITLGAPLRHMTAHPIVRALAKHVMRQSRRRTGGPCLRHFADGLRTCLPDSLPHSAICSKGDAVVDWADCTGANGALDIEVSGTHIGMPANPAVYRQVAQLLAESQHAGQSLAPDRALDRAPNSRQPLAA